MISEGKEMKIVRCRENFNLLYTLLQTRKCDHISNQINERSKEETVEYY